jgi:hypothetical protein
MNEWLKGYGGVVAHGFVALQGIASDDEARDVFKKIDDNGGGILLLDEWCFFLKNCEIAADTAIGKLLALDEAGGVGKKESLFGNTMAIKLAGVKPGELVFSSVPIVKALGIPI